MLKYIAHSTLQAACWRSARKFRLQRNQLEAVQRAKLQKLLIQTNNTVPNKKSTISWETYRDSFPVTHYADWQSRITEQKSGNHPLSNSPLVRYQPTSGSSEKLKLIPYTKLFLQELDDAICPWITSLYQQYPAIKQGSHYWSVSWLPQNQFEQLQGNLNDDSELLGSAKRLITGLSQAVSSDVALSTNPNDSLFATLCYLVASPDLTVMSVWSPTFALQLLDMLPFCSEEIALVLKQKNWGKRRHSLSKLKPPFAPKRARLLLENAHKPQLLPQLLWPNLALISAWDTADAAPWAAQLSLRFPNTCFEGKGLWATEGVVTIPVDNHYPLAYRSHVYEFEDLNSGEIKAPWELKEGDEVSPILSGGNGLLRYALEDRMVVSEFWGQVPCFTFLGRRNGVDMVGEKLSPETARMVLKVVAQQFGVEPITLLAIKHSQAGKSRYVAVFGRNNPSQLTHFSSQMANAVEQLLSSHFHYALARDLNQLLPVQAVLAADGWALNKRLAMAAGMIEGNIKPEALRKVPFGVFDHLSAEYGQTA